MVGPESSRNRGYLLVGHVLIQQRVTSRQELVIAGQMLRRHGRVHLENGQQCRLGQIELKTRGGRAGRVGQGKPPRPVMVGRRPEFSRSVPRGRMLLIDTALKKVVRAGLVRS